MSRREFRGRVEGPRPPAAWLMSLVAAATLWLTEQLPPWLVAVQLAAFAFSFATRHAPPAFRSSPVWLNVLMAGITTITIRSALAGNPATISLAYFTALAQGLQLLDARPRKSEFVLVAVALFQVVLASNLTDSVFFPPLVLVFLASVTWTLLVHTLALEAAEAGDPQAAERVVAPDLRRLTFVATSACVVLAMGLFIVLPRLKTSVLQGGLRSGMSLSGFSDKVALGDVGRIRLDHSVVLRVEALDGELPDPVDAYWRGLAFDAFDGRSWSISPAEHAGLRQPINGIGRFGIELRPQNDAPVRVQRILREALDAEVLFSAGDARRIEGPFQRLERDANGGLYVPGHGPERLRYTIWTSTPARDVRRLAGERALPPVEPGPRRARSAKRADRYLALPPLDARVAARAAALVAGAPNDYERALRLEAALRRDGRYTDSPPPLGDEKTSPIEAFVLGELEGHCEYFASAMVVLARAQGLPARLVNGFAGGQPNPVGGFIEVTQADAHAWVEIHFERSGWVRFDPTPPDRRLRAETALSLAERAAQLASAVELWWFQRVVDYDSADQIGALRALWRRFSPEAASGLADAREEERERGRERFGFDLEGWSDPRLLGALVALAGLLAAARFLRAKPQGPDPIPLVYRRAQRILARRGIRRAPNVSALDFAEAVAARLPDPGARAFREITAAYLAERFGAARPQDREAELAALQDAVDRMGLGDHAHVR
jgi:transglutaminase-like putative cysteine protease